MLLPGRKTPSIPTYRFGFNGQERDNEISGTGNLNTAMFWEYDTRLVRRWNLDPKPIASNSNYVCFNNNPIFLTDLNGDSTIYMNTQNEILYKTYDKLPNSITIITDKAMLAFNSWKEKVEENGKMDNDGMNNLMRSFDGVVNYPVNDYFTYYEQHKNDVYSKPDRWVADGKGPLIKENQTQINFIKGYMRISGPQDNDGSPTQTDNQQGNAESSLHTHPNEGRLIKYANGRKVEVQSGIYATSTDQSNSTRQINNVGTGFYKINITSSEIRLYNYSQFINFHKNTMFKR